MFQSYKVDLDLKGRKTHAFVTDFWLSVLYLKIR
jgi:hypothetical protein